jgi:hypothetical protein
MHKQARAYLGTKQHRPWSLQLPRGQATRDSSHASQTRATAALVGIKQLPCRAHGAATWQSTNAQQASREHPVQGELKHDRANAPGHQPITQIQAGGSRTHSSRLHTDMPITQIQAWRSRTHSSRLLDRAHSSRSPTDHTDSGWSGGARRSLAPALCGRRRGLVRLGGRAGFPSWRPSGARRSR